MTPTLMLQKLFEIRDQIHYLHLNTTSYARHKALNSFYDDWLDTLDEFVETYQGKYGRVTGKITISINEQVDPVDYLKQVYACLETECKSMVSKSDDDLLNIIADMKQLVNQTLYLLTLI